MTIPGISDRQPLHTCLMFAACCFTAFSVISRTPSSSRRPTKNSLQCGQCSCPEFGLVVNHTDVSRLALETPNVILFETTRDKRGTYGLPTDFEVELMIIFCEEEYFLVDISFYQPGHYISQSLRLNADSELRWYQREHFRGRIDPSVPNTVLAPQIPPPTTRTLMEMQQQNTSVSNLTYVKKTAVLQRYASEYYLGRAAFRISLASKCTVNNENLIRAVWIHS